MMEVKLAPVARADREQPERTITDNISPRALDMAVAAWRAGRDYSHQGWNAYAGRGGLLPKS